MALDQLLDQPVVETGDFRNGRWRAFELQNIKPSEGGMRVPVSSNQAMSLLLVCEKRALPRWRKSLERAMTDPGSLR